MISSRCWERMEYLEDRIEERQALKEAQVPYNLHYEFFQQVITNLTLELRDWETNISQIVALNDRIDRIGSRANADEREARHVADNWSRAAVGCGLIGVPLSVIGLAWTSNLIAPGMGVVLLLLAWRFRYLEKQTRSSAQLAKDAALNRVQNLQVQRDGLIPPTYDG